MSIEVALSPSAVVVGVTFPTQPYSPVGITGSVGVTFSQGTTFSAIVSSHLSQVIIPIENASNIGIELSGTWAGSISSYASANGTNYTILNGNLANQGYASTFTSGTQVNFPVGGFKSVLLQTNSWTSGTLIINSYASQASNNGYVQIVNTVGITGTGIGVTFPTGIGVTFPQLGSQGITGVVGITLNQTAIGITGTGVGVTFPMMVGLTGTLVISSHPSSPEIAVDGSGTTVAEMFGTWTGNVTFGGSADGTHWSNLSGYLQGQGYFPTYTSNFQVFLPTSGLKKIRVSTNSWTSGTLSINTYASPGPYSVVVQSSVQLPVSATFNATAIGITGTGIGVTFPVLSVTFPIQPYNPVGITGTVGITGIVGVTLGQLAVGITGTGIGVTLNQIAIGITGTGLGVTFPTGVYLECLGTTLGKTQFFKTAAVTTSSTALAFFFTAIPAAGTCYWVQGYEIEAGANVPTGGLMWLGDVSFRYTAGTTISLHRMVNGGAGIDRVLMNFPEPIFVGNSQIIEMAYSPGNTNLLRWTANMWGYQK